MCQQTASLSSNKLHRCCARCCTPRGCTAQQQQPASAARSESRWRIDSSTFLVDEPTRQRCAVHQLATQAAATRSRRGGAIKRREKPLSFEIPAILTPGICAGRFTSCVHAIRHMTDKEPKGPAAPRDDAHKGAPGDETRINTRQNTPGDNLAPQTYRSHYIPSVTCAKGDRGGSVWTVGHDGPRTLHRCVEPARLERKSAEADVMSCIVRGGE